MGVLIDGLERFSRKKSTIANTYDKKTLEEVFLKIEEIKDKEKKNKKQK